MKRAQRTYSNGGSNSGDEIAERHFRSASRRALFRGDGEIPGVGRSAAEIPERHLRHKVTMNLDEDIITFFKERAAIEKTPYQFLINQVLREYIHGSRPEQLAAAVGEVLLTDDSFCERLRGLLIRPASAPLRGDNE